VRELHVVAMSEDGRHVVLGTRKGVSRGEFKVALDDRLAAAMRGELPRPGERSVRDIVLSPKEIQARLRAGESTEQIAASAGVPVARVERYAGPVLSEREKVINGARAAVLARSRRGLSGLPMGEAVAQHLSQAAGYKPESTRWSARREPSGRWVIELSYVARAATRTAAWRFDPSTREITALDAASTALAHVDPTLGQRAAATERLPAPKPLRAPRQATARAAAATAGKPSSRPAAVAAAAAKAPVVKAPGTRVPTAKAPAAKAPVATGTGKRAVASGRFLPGRTIAAPGAAKVSAAPSPHPAGAAPAGQAPTTPAAAAAEAAAAAAVAEAAAAAAAAETAAAAAAAEIAAVAAAEPAPSEPAPSEPALSEPAPASAPPPATPPAADARSGPPTLRVVPHPESTAEPAAGAEPPAEAAEPPPPARRAAGVRASVPAWADVLLGIAPVDRPRDADKGRD